MNKSQETTVFSGHQKLTSAMNYGQKSDGRLQIWCSIQVSLHREPLEVGLVESSGKMDVDVDRQIVQASKAFGALRKSVFLDKNLSLCSKRKVYKACILSVLLYDAECWTPPCEHEKRLNTFHHRCNRIILGIINRQQWTERKTIKGLRRRWGDEELAAEKVMKRRLEWLGYIARMPDHRLPKSMLFGWLPQPCPRCGPKKRWRDVERTLKDIGMDEKKWYGEARKSRAGWKAVYRLGVESCRKEKLQQAPVAVRKVVCGMCSRRFRRECDRKGINGLIREESWFGSKRVLFNACYVKGGLEVNWTWRQKCEDRADIETSDSNNEDVR